MSKTIKSTVKTDEPFMVYESTNLLENGGLLKRVIGYGANIIQMGVDMSVLPPILGWGARMMKYYSETNTPQYQLKPINEQKPFHNRYLVHKKLNPTMNKYAKFFKNCACAAKCNERMRKGGYDKLGILCKQCIDKCTLRREEPL